MNNQVNVVNLALIYNYLANKNNKISLNIINKYIGIINKYLERENKKKYLLK